MEQTPFLVLSQKSQKSVQIIPFFVSREFFEWKSVDVV
jgi:hypothetical protein